jgi:hypothetical protein
MVSTTTMALLLRPGFGRAITNDLVSDVDPDAESNYYIYTNANSTITLTDADAIVHTAGVAYLGWVVTP